MLSHFNVKLGSGQVISVKLNSNNDIVVYVNNFVTEQNCGFYLMNWEVLCSNMPSITNVLEDVKEICFYYYYFLSLH